MVRRNPLADLFSSRARETSPQGTGEAMLFVPSIALGLRAAESSSGTAALLYIVAFLFENRLSLAWKYAA